MSYACLVKKAGDSATAVKYTLISRTQIIQEVGNGGGGIIMKKDDKKRQKQVNRNVWLTD